MMNPSDFMMLAVQRMCLFNHLSLDCFQQLFVFPPSHCFGVFCGSRCLKTINSKKYGVDLVCFTSHPTTVIYSSKNGWDGNVKYWNVSAFICKFTQLFYVNYKFISLESLRLLSLNDNKYLRYFKGHHDRFIARFFYFFVCLFSL